MSRSDSLRQPATGVSPVAKLVATHVAAIFHSINRALRIRSTGTQVRGKPHFHKALTIVRAAQDRPILVFYRSIYLYIYTSVQQKVFGEYCYSEFHAHDRKFRQDRL